jgi:hypothetical protein
VEVVFGRFRQRILTSAEGFVDIKTEVGTFDCYSSRLSAFNPVRGNFEPFDGGVGLKGRKLKCKMNNGAGRPGSHPQPDGAQFGVKLEQLPHIWNQLFPDKFKPRHTLPVVFGQLDGKYPSLIVDGV